MKKRVEEELEKRKDEIEQEVAKRVEEAKRKMEKEMMEELERQREQQRREEQARQVTGLSAHQSCVTTIHYLLFLHMTPPCENNLCSCSLSTVCVNSLSCIPTLYTRETNKNIISIISVKGAVRCSWSV